MKIVLSTLGSAGDVFPFLGLAIELRHRGYDVSLATNPYFEESIRDNGIAFEAIGTREDFLECARNPELWHPTKAIRHLFRFLLPGMRKQYELIAAANQQGPTASIVNCFGFGALFAQEKLGIPAITIHLQPAVIWSKNSPPHLPGMKGPNWLRNFQFYIGERFFFDRIACPKLNRFRSDIGLNPNLRKLTRAWNSPKGIVCLFPNWFAPQQDDWPSPCIQTGFPLWNDRSQFPLDPYISRFCEQADAPIVFAPGSANQHASSFFRAAVDACCKLKRRGILLSSFTDQLPIDLPNEILAVKYAPLDLLLPKASLLVYHGGIGTASQAIKAGIPHLIMPMAHDQFDNANRLKKLNVGDWIPRAQFTPSAVATKIRNISLDLGYAQKARELANKLKGIDALRDTASACIRLLNT